MHGQAHPEHPSRSASALRSACEREGCPICTVLLAEMDHAMDSWNYEGFTDVAHRHAVIRARGFCPQHTWQLAERNNAFQLAVIYRELLSDVLPTLDATLQQAGNAASAHRGRSWLRRVLGGEASSAEDESLFAACFFCRTRATIEARLVETLVSLLASQEDQAHLRNSTGLCRLHFLQALRFAQEHHAPQYAVLVECQRACLKKALEEVEELIRKHDYRFGNETRGEEMTAWRRAAALFAGNRGVL